MRGLISDIKLPPDEGQDGFQPDVLMLADYDNYGMLRPNRTYSLLNHTYEYGFQGMRRMVQGDRSSLYTTLFRTYDAATGARTSHDPTIHAGASPYNGLDGNPTSIIDPYGLDGDASLMEGATDRSIAESKGYVQSPSQSIRSAKHSSGSTSGSGTTARNTQNASQSSSGSERTFITEVKDITSAHFSGLRQGVSDKVSSIGSLVTDPIGTLNNMAQQEYNSINSINNIGDLGVYLRGKWAQIDPTMMGWVVDQNFKSFESLSNGSSTVEVAYERGYDAGGKAVEMGVEAGTAVVGKGVAKVVTTVRQTVKSVVTRSVVNSGDDAAGVVTLEAEAVAASNLQLQSSTIEAMGNSYSAIAEVTVPIKNSDLLIALNNSSKGDWVKVYEAGILNGEKIEIHYFRNHNTKQVFDVKKKI